MSRLAREILTALVVLALGAGVGWFLGAPLVGLLAAAFLLLLRLWVALARASAVLKGGRSLPSGAGPWAPFAGEILRLRAGSDEAPAGGGALAVPALRRLLEMFPDAVVALDEDSRIVALNEGAGRLLHLDLEEDRGQRIDLLVRHPDFLRRLHEPADGTPVEFHPGGAEDAPIRAWILPLDGAHRLLLLRPLREERRQEEQGRLFLSNASHELRTPVTVLMGHLELLRDQPALAASLRPSVEIMHRESVRMNHLLRNLLELLRLDAELVRPRPPTPVAVEALLETLVERSRGRGRLVVDGGGTTDRILGQEFELVTAFWNLVDNALKFGGAAGEVRVAWSDDGEGGCFAVSDEGPGIDPVDLPRLGERFYRAAGARAAGVEGSGLGLAIVEAVLARHGASLRIESTPGRGTCVRCLFPAAALVRDAASHAHGVPRGEGVL